MRLTLEPIDNPDIEPIPVNEALFDIGRAAPPFAQYPENLVVQLSRRHARLFDVQGACFIMDQGSQNGTLLNGTPVGKTPAPIAHGDEIETGGLRFRIVDHSEREPTAPQASERKIQLVPRSAESAPLLFVNEFPCLVSKSEGVIARYCAVRSIDPQFLSRRHAVFIAIGDDLFLEDLGSTNGTEVNGRRLTDEPAKLANGDVIQFGDIADLAFEVNILGSQADLEATVVAAQADLAPAGDEGEAGDPSRTILMEDADDFLNIFVNEPPKEERSPEPQQAAAPAPGLFTYLGREWRALMGHRMKIPGLRQPIPLPRYLFSLVVIALLALFAWRALRVDYLDESRALYDAGQYEEAARWAARGLDAAPEDASLKELSTKSTLRWVVPPWQDALRRNDYAAADEALAQAQFVEAGNGEAATLLQLLDWAGRLQQTSTELQSRTAAAIAQQKTQIKQLLQFWASRSRLNQHYLGLIKQHHPIFADTEEQILRQLRALDSIESVYLPAIEALDDELADALAVDDIDEARLLLDDFDQKYPDLQGTGELRRDVDDYAALLQLLEQDEMLELVSLREQTAFATDLVQRASDQRFGAVVPQADELALINAAREAWRNGELQLALDTLAKLLQQQDSQPASDLQLRYQATLQKYDALLQGGQSTTDAERTLALIATLDPEQDKHLYDTLQQAMPDAENRVQGDINTLLRSAESAWSDYHAQGGITASLRLETNISAEFEQRAGALLQAHEQIESAAAKSALSQTELEESARLLRQEIAAEIKLQRNSIGDLMILLGEELTANKLGLLAAGEGAKATD